MMQVYGANQCHKLERFIGDVPVYLKIEGLNPAGSIKLKTAVSLIEESERLGFLSPGRKVIESSSGNLGIALAIICAQRGYPFTCVTDPNVNQVSVNLMRAYGAQVIVCDTRDGNGGFLGARIALIKDMIRKDPAYFWTNQYANPANPLAHYNLTAPEVLQSRPDCKWLFVGAGTTGTLTGCARYLRDKAPGVKLVAVDTVGSINFQDVPQKRLIPGLGTSRRPEILDRGLIEHIEFVDEVETIRMCRSVAQDYGLLLGGSTGTVLAAVKRLGAQIPAGEEVVVISPDMGERYLETIYSDKWCDANFGDRLYQHALVG
ncbi:2,3-diaminopropionate biosynthesis protein SbnA [Pseudomonas sp. MSSRFD41]|uniref:2,3-diaminopropionate biosynthesis protein SbnA n=1 Tax=unclassified Pseudomonas TaxID=196821 RepID=UPI001639C8B7|nr:2,3-diaminopropionate biosynthesis protein SbnA [Pseudomonas sp. MSSRFD41]MBC2656611.1 2,3-diaminopropionate biosynthesis protein SbnA [Pseudomonas sp. MSSRFD41]